MENCNRQKKLWKSCYKKTRVHHNFFHRFYQKFSDQVPQLQIFVKEILLKWKSNIPLFINVSNFVLFRSYVWNHQFLSNQMRETSRIQKWYHCNFVSNMSFLFCPLYFQFQISMFFLRHLKKQYYCNGSYSREIHAPNILDPSLSRSNIFPPLIWFICSGFFKVVLCWCIAYIHCFYVGIILLVHISI